MGQKTPEQPDIKDLLPRAVTPGKPPARAAGRSPGTSRTRHRTVPARAF